MSQNQPPSQVTATASSGSATSPPLSGSRPGSEHNNSPSASTGNTAGGIPYPVKPRSCVTCRARKVRCDKISPCSNCQRAGIACIFPATDRPPRWARRLTRPYPPAVGGDATPRRSRGQRAVDAQQPVPVGQVQVMDRLHKLENLVKELSSQIERGGGVPGTESPGSHVGLTADMSNTTIGDVAAEVGGPALSHMQHTHQRAGSDGAPTSSGRLAPSVEMHSQFGRLVLDDASRTRYISNGFWTRVNDELEGLKMDTRGWAAEDSDFSEDEDSQGRSTMSTEPTPSERHAFLFRHNLGQQGLDVAALHPLPSQVPFLVNVYAENVNILMQVGHIPTVTKLVRGMHHSQGPTLTPANEALMFAIYYAAVMSMEGEDIIKNFASSKAELSHKYRTGFEHAMARADFLNVPDLTTVQALAIFLFLVRRQESPRWVWMMTGLVIRMGLAIGLHRDGARLKHLTCYDVEIRRRVWWCLCTLDVRAAEDQGTDLTIAHGMFDTKLPMHINDSDIDPSKDEQPTALEGLTDMTYTLYTFEVCEMTRRMMAPRYDNSMPSLDELGRMLQGLYDRVGKTCSRLASGEAPPVAQWVAVIIARIVVAKMSLILYMPLLFSTPDENMSAEIRTKLFVAAIEVAEYNHALNSEHACRNWRWVFQTYTQWHAIVFLLIEIARRPWSPTVERAWVALHSEWLIPDVRTTSDKNARIWVPLRRLMARARRHRQQELERLRDDPRAVQDLEMEDATIAAPARDGPFPDTVSVELFRERWRKLVSASSAGKAPAPPAEVPPRNSVSPRVMSSSGITAHDSAGPLSISPQRFQVQRHSSPAPGQQQQQHGGNIAVPSRPSAQISTPSSGSDISGLMDHQQQSLPPPYNNPFQPLPSQQDSISAGHHGSDPRTIGYNYSPWLWADSDPSSDVFGNVPLDDGDLNMDLDLDTDVAVNWQDWLESVRGMETGRGTDPYGHGTWTGLS
ncbi:fungal-specific transcription factor domain-containing protein [Diplogelasinospora grovesii]|uniref:Fungal-specific transcription factor domain-containing protein n=1 Tax=Diplogelasinospora grovesii TaxID=303347 RepID=A0AAN6NB41_9PEZI|nr:fungal-specific transcription factor domain-containing protein [Diplogelasinospora grovesii]